jgi:uncharacterized protein YkwD
MMKSALRWLLALAVMMAAWPLLPPAWGQIRTQSGALTGLSGVKHLKEVERLVFRLTNEARRKNGLPSLETDADLTVMARKHTDDMLRQEFFSHTGPDGKTLKDRLFDAPAVFKTVSRAGENIYGGSGQDFSDAKTMARVMVDGWMTSPGHRANILNPAYTHLGVGVGVLGKEIRATQNFARKKTQP